MKIKLLKREASRKPGGDDAERTQAPPATAGAVQAEDHHLRQQGENLSGQGGRAQAAISGRRSAVRGEPDQDEAALRPASVEIQGGGGSIGEFEAEIEKANILWDVGQAAAAAGESAGMSDEDFYAKIKVKSSLNAIQDKLNMSFAQLDVALLTEKEPNLSLPGKDPHARCALRRQGRQPGRESMRRTHATANPHLHLPRDMSRSPGSFMLSINRSWIIPRPSRTIPMPRPINTGSRSSARTSNPPPPTTTRKDNVKYPYLVALALSGLISVLRAQDAPADNAPVAPVNPNAVTLTIADGSSSIPMRKSSSSSSRSWRNRSTCRRCSPPERSRISTCSSTTRSSSP